MATSWSQRLQTLLVQQKKVNNSNDRSSLKRTTTHGSAANSVLLPVLLWRHHNGNTSDSYDGSLDHLVILNSVFIGGSQYTKQQILEHVRRTYTWIEVSNISFQLLHTQFYPHNIDLVLNHLFNGRTEPKVYVHSDQEIKLYQQVLNRITMANDGDTANTTTTTQLTDQTLQKIFEECCDCLQESSTSRIVMIIDCRHKYFTQYSTNIQRQLFLQTVSYAAMMSKRHLYPFIEFILVKDHETEPNHCHNQPQCNTHLIYKQLMLIIDREIRPLDTILTFLDIDRISAIIVAAYRSSC